MTKNNEITANLNEIKTRLCFMRDESSDCIRRCIKNIEEILEKDAPKKGKRTNINKQNKKRG